MRDLAHHPRVCQVAFLLVQKNQMRDNRFDYVVTLLQISHAKHTGAKINFLSRNYQEFDVNFVKNDTLKV